MATTVWILLAWSNIKWLVMKPKSSNWQNRQAFPEKALKELIARPLIVLNGPLIVLNGPFVVLQKRCL